MPSILLTGVSTLDIINHVETYPDEDSEVRAVSQQIRSGGNASNMAIVIQQLGIQANLLAKRADDSNASLIFSYLENKLVQTSFCPVQKHSSTPTSYITLNQANGSRTIVHYRKLDELDIADFNNVDLNQFDWLHFEARNCHHLLAMLKHSLAFNKPVSIELEKPREAIEDILPYANVLLISKPFAESQGFSSAEDCLLHFSEQYPDKTITCTWGELGAWAYFPSQLIHQAAPQVSRVVETIGAGDTFNAGFISSLINGQSVNDSLEFATKLATKKCQQSGFDNL